MDMYRLLLIFLAIPALTLAQENDPDLQASGLTLVDDAYERLPGPEKGDMPAMEAGNLEVICLLKKNEIDFSMKVKSRPEGELLVVDTPMPAFRYCLLNVYGKILYSAAIYSKEKQIDLCTIPQGTYFIRVDHQNTHRIFKPY